MSGCNYNKKMRNILIEYFSLIVTTAFIWGITCESKGIWPFGQMLLNIGDMAEECVPMYTHLWDVLHGKKALFFDWYTGLGSNMAGSVLYFGLISPFNIFFLFIKRAAVEESMSIYILIKLVAIGFSMRFLLKKWFPELSGWMRFSFSLLYVFSTFNMQYYYAPMWLDVAFMFPLVMYGYFLLMNNGKRIPYIICLSITCMMSFQHTYMLFLMLLFLTGFLPVLSREKYQKALPVLLMATLTAMLLASWIFVPGAIQVLSTSRAGHNYGIWEIWSSVWIFFTAKWMKLLNMGIPLAFFLAYAGKNRKEKAVKFFSFVIGLVCAPIVLESTNLLWHGGSYQGYTMRFAYMVAFWIIMGGAYACNKEYAGQEREKKVKWIGFASIFILAMTTVIQYICLKSDMTVYKDSISAVGIILLTGITTAAGVGILYCERKIYEKFLSVIIIFQSLTLALTMVIVSGDKENSFAAVSNVVNEENHGDLNPANRIKSMDVEFGHNYPFIMCKNAASHYLGEDSEKALEGFSNLGYAKIGYRISDYGGTLFSDALLGVREVISGKEVNEDLYEYQNTYKDYRIYRSLYGYEQGIKIEDLISGNAITDNPFELQNKMAKAICKKELLDIIEKEGSNFGISVKEKSVLYLYTEGEENFEEVIVRNRKTKEICKLTLHESGWMNGILELGTWENAALEVSIKSKEAVRKVVCALLPLQEFTENKPNYYEDFVMEKGRTSLNIKTGGATENAYLFLPFWNDRGWKCSVNNERVEIKDFAQFFMAIPLQAGENEIRLSFSPTGLIIGLIMTALGMMGVFVLRKNPFPKEWKTAEKTLWLIDEVIFGMLILVFYIMPVIILIEELTVSVF